MGKIKSIVHFSQDFSRGKAQLGGYGRVLNMTNDGNDHYIFTISKSKPEEIVTKIHDQLTIIQFPEFLPPKKIFKKRKIVNKISDRIASFIKGNDIEVDILFGHSQLINFFVLYELKKKHFLHVKLIWEFNAIWSEIDVKGIKNIIAIKYFNFLEKQIVRKSDAVVVQTISSKERIVSKFKILDKKIIVLPNAVSKNFEFHYFTKIEKPFKVLINGLFDEMNGLKFICDFFNKNRSLNNFEFHFYGRGPLDHLVNQVSVSSNIFYHGVVDRNFLLEKLKSFHFILIPRIRVPEADLFTPSKLIEAMGSGLIPIVTDVKGMTGVVNDSNGFVIKENDFDLLLKTFNRIENLNKSILIQKSEKCMHLIKDEYTWGTNHERLDMLYTNLEG